MRNSFFLLTLNTNPPREEADRRSKSKHSVILLKSMLFWPEPRSDECRFLSLELWTFCYALMNSIVPCTNQVLPLLEQLTPWTRDRVKLLQSPYFFRPLNPCFWPHHPYPQAFCTLPSFAHIKRPRWRPFGLNDRHLRSHREIGDCEQSSTVGMHNAKLGNHLHILWLSFLTFFCQTCICYGTWWQPIPCAWYTCLYDQMGLKHGDDMLMAFQPIRVFRFWRNKAFIIFSQPYPPLILCLQLSQTGVKIEGRWKG